MFCLAAAVAVQAGWLAGAVAAEPLTREQLLALALERSPRIAAARERVRRLTATRRGVAGFFDPVVVASGERSEGRLGEDWRLATGVEMAARPGVYVGAGVEENYLYRHVGGHEWLFQTALKASIRVPLLRDAGFRQWRYDDLVAASQVREGVAGLLTVVQDLRHLIDGRYISLLEAMSSYEVAKAATVRVEKLHRDAQEMVRLKAVPEYQLANARLEVQLAREDELRAQNACESARLRLMELVGTNDVGEVKADPQSLLPWSRSVAVAEGDVLAQAMANRGESLALRATIETVELQIRRDADQLRPDLSLSAEAAFTGEDPEMPVASGQYVSDDSLGGTVALVYRKPLGQRAERARLEAYRARIAEVQEQIRDVEARVRSDLEIARRGFASARERLELVTQSVESAKATLAAEEERFRLGDGRSRNVLDAQKDLTSAVQRETRTAAILLQAWTDYLFAAGYGGPGEVPSPVE